MNLARILHSFILFSIILLIIITIKPSFIYKENGELKSFGINQNKDETIFHLGVISVVVAILCFWFVAVNDYANSLNIEELNELKTFSEGL